MGIKRADQKLIIASIKGSRIEGKTDREIYDELSEQGYHTKAIALLITGTVTEELKDQYGKFNNILLGLLYIGLVLKLLTVFSAVVQTQQPVFLLLVLIVPLINIYFIVEITKFKAPVYRLCGLLTIASAFQSIPRSENWIEMVINIVFSLSIVILSFYLDFKMFPRYKPSELKKGRDGEYIH